MLSRDNEDKKYLAIAIQTVMYNYKERLARAEGLNDELLVRMSEDILNRALNYKQITEELMVAGHMDEVGWYGSGK